MAVMTVEKNTRCRWCGEQHELMTNPYMAEGDPENGDMTMCFSCGEFNVFSGKAASVLRKPNAKERRMLAADPRIKDMRQAWLQTMRNKIKWLPPIEPS
jgi:hypothetical protein